MEELERQREETRARRDRQWEADLQKMNKAQRSQAKKKRLQDAKVVNLVLSSPDHYKTLRLSRPLWNPWASFPKSASPKQVKKAYRDLARKVHPDKNKDGRAEEAFDKIQEAYETLSDKGKKREYDRKEERKRKARKEERKEIAVEGAGKVRRERNVEGGVGEKRKRLRNNNNKPWSIKNTNAGNSQPNQKPHTQPPPSGMGWVATPLSPYPPMG